MGGHADGVEEVALAPSVVDPFLGSLWPSLAKQAIDQVWERPQADLQRVLGHQAKAEVCLLLASSFGSHLEVEASHKASVE